MLEAFTLACRDTLAPTQRRALAISLVGGAVIFVLLAAGCGVLLDQVGSFGTVWIDLPIRLLGGIAVLFLAWLLFPAIVTLVLGFFLDGVVDRLAAEHRLRLPAPRRVGLGATIGSVLSLAALAVLVNLAALPFFLWPVINLFVYYGLNAYLLGREYFDLVMLRRLDAAARRKLWRRHRGRLIVAGLVVAFLMSLPLVNLAAPLLAASFMLHIVARLEPWETGNERSLRYPGA